MNMQIVNQDPGLDDPRISATLKDLHQRAKGDRWVFLRALPAVGLASLTGRNIFAAAAPYLKDAYIPVDPDQGALLYLTARAIGARNIVEFGTSFGISTIYLAAAARANDGRVIGTELESKKVNAARANVAQAGLAQFVDVLEGDAMKTLANVEQPIDFLLLDGWKGDVLARGVASAAVLGIVLFIFALLSLRSRTARRPTWCHRRIRIHPRQFHWY